MLLKRAGVAAVAVLLISIMIVVWLRRDPPAVIGEPNNEYDYIIVGGGTAGSVLAGRLSEKHSVLLIESGGQYGFLSSLPLAAPFLQMSENDWHFHTIPQVNSSFGLVNKISFWPRGRGLGGTGRMNYMVHYPGTRKDFDRWVKLGGNGWEYDILKQYINKLRGRRYRREEFQVEDHVCSARHVFKTSATCPALSDTQYRITTKLSKKVWTDEPRIRVAREEKESNSLLNALTEAAKELRHLKLVVWNGEATIHRGIRWDAYKSHLEKVVNSGRNLHILLKTDVARVIIQNNRAQAVEYHVGNHTRVVAARREVILCAGAVQSPAILMRSGIGPGRALQRLGIKLVADLPVGSNLHDHLNVPMYISIEKEVSVTLSKVLKFSQLFKYLLFKKGLFASSAVAGTVSAPNGVGIILFGMGSTEEQLLRVIANYREDVFRAVFPHHKNYSQEGFVFLVSCLSPQSRGSITLRSSAPKDAPFIDPNYLSQPEDVDCTRRGIKLAKRLVMTAGFKKLGARLHLPELANCAHFQANINDNEYLECVIRTVGFTGYHPGGSVAMGAVLDSYLRVKGVGKLRVVDASVFPAPVQGTPNSVVMAVAERAAHIIDTSPSLKLGRSPAN